LQSEVNERKLMSLVRGELKGKHFSVTTTFKSFKRSLFFSSQCSIIFRRKYSTNAERDEESE
jgi:hypothetical protein